MDFFHFPNRKYIWKWIQMDHLIFFSLAMLDEPTFFLMPYFRQGQFVAEFSSPSQAVRKHCKVRVGDEDWAMLQLGWDPTKKVRETLIFKEWLGGFKEAVENTDDWGVASFF